MSKRTNLILFISPHLLGNKTACSVRNIGPVLNMTVGYFEPYMRFHREAARVTSWQADIHDNQTGERFRVRNLSVGFAI
jgi:hypothetical protein